MEKKFTRLLLLMVFTCFQLMGQVAAASEATDEAPVQDWTVFIYMCGSDLETKYGSASRNIAAMLEEPLPEGVNFVIQAGGSAEWQNDNFDANSLNLALVDNEGYHDMARIPDGNMGDGTTLEKFLAYTKEYPAKHKMLIFWNHGGGTLGGVCNDERYQDSLSLNQIQKAFKKNWTGDQPPFDIVCFDACLMATYSTANMLQGMSQYMIASEEIIPEHGFDYHGLVNRFVANPQIEPEELGRYICEDYLDFSESQDTQDMVTLSLIDLKQFPKVVKAYENFGQKIFENQKKDADLLGLYARTGRKVENYGGNTKEEGFMDMIDIGDQAEALLDVAPKESEALLDAIDQTVPFRIYGTYRENSHGLSAYYPLSGDKEYLSIFQDVQTASPIHKKLYKQLLTKSVVHLEDLENLPLTRTADAVLMAKVPQKYLSSLDTVRCIIGLELEDENVYVSLGEDANIIADWDKGEFRDNFTGTWAAIDGHFVNLYVADEQEKYISYIVPIVLNGEEYNLEVVYDYDKDGYRILGARKDNDNLISQRKLEKLKAGDTITLQAYAQDLDNMDANAEAEVIELDTFVWEDNLQMVDQPLGDGTYAYFFEFVTPQQDYYISDVAYFQIQDDDIYLMDNQ